MSKHPAGIEWPAPGHTLAKIAILRAYLQAWFKILGTAVPRDLLYVDGFAGPGGYAGGEDGSPMVAIKVASDARTSSGTRWRAKTVRIVLVESDAARFNALKSRIAAHRREAGLRVQCINDEFASAFETIKGEHREAFTSSMPLFAFLDPFGVKGIPFHCVREILSSETSEVFLLLDTDGIERIRSAGDNAGHKKILDEVFGGPAWQNISFSSDSRVNGQIILAAYREQLRNAAGVKFTFSFEMRKSNGALSHHLLFATKHIRGLEKMKEAMASVDKTFIFVGGRANQQFLFNTDDPVVVRSDAENYFQQQCSGREKSFDEVRSWILQETPYLRPDGILNEIRARHGIEAITVGGNVASSLPRGGKWADVDKIKFREQLAPRNKGLFGQE